MQRREFLNTSAALGISSAALAQTPMPMDVLGKSQLKVSKICVGGYHMRVGGEIGGIRIIRRALELGVNFFDSAAKYHNGESDVTYGKVFGDSPSLRQRVLLMSKAENRTRDGAMLQLENTLRRMKTDYLDLWQCHEVVTLEEVKQIFGPGGSLEAFVKAKEQGKVRHIGFTGHADPNTHLALLNGYNGWETVQCPVNLIDPHYLSFIKNVHPKVRERGLGLIGMKSNAIGSITKMRIATIEECLRFAWTQNPNTLVSGVESVDQLEQNVAVLKTLKKMTPAEMSSILDRTSKGPVGSKIESYKKKESTAMHHAVHRDGDPAEV
ncbi:aldo/keto reductase [Bryobacter aggregatus]|uniref:aldo/keto reductase n=1 Tax=Bryobacter aggregatus TaxID=360054 RepID=UPI00068F89F2|nr:aldo/keto reductase [Bryobacter aggregatus]